jgi:aryl-alcohol dehydrogenase-like predicted oxidoreductase
MSFLITGKPSSLLGRHRLLSPTAGVRVSPLALGGMNFGTAWKDSVGECSKETAFEIMDYFYAQGGNWIDTAVNYQSGESEQWIGEWMEERAVRDEIVLATKFTGMQMTDRVREGGTAIKSNYTGNSAKNIHTSIERSLKQLRTSYIDIVSTGAVLYLVTLTIVRSIISTSGIRLPRYLSSCIRSMIYVHLEKSSISASATLPHGLW